jgi:hypothetical protein
LPAPEIVAAAVAGDLAAARSIPGPKRAPLLADLRKTIGSGDEDSREDRDLSLIRQSPAGGPPPAATAPTI